ncbi:MAG: host-nuclease inhibitor Gam family protein [Aquabacterium sp.]
MIELTEVQAAARAYADARARLAERVAVLNDGIEQLKRDNLPGVRRALERAAQLEAELRAAVEAAPHLFAKPRTVVMHGVRVGYEKGKGRIEFSDAAQVVRLVRKHLPDQAEVLIQVKEQPVKSALAQLTAADLRRLGCTVEEAGDAVVIRPVDTDVDKLVAALLKSAAQEAQAE